MKPSLHSGPLSPAAPALSAATDPQVSAAATRRQFLAQAGMGLATVSLPRLLLPQPVPGGLLRADEAGSTSGGASSTWEPAETAVKQLFELLSPEQRQQVCFDWDHKDPQKGLLRAYVANNWNITKPTVNSRFFTDDQKDLIKTIFEGVIHPDWRERYHRQLKEDCGGFGEGQSIALFGQPGAGPFEFVFTGRHITLRCDGNSTERAAFGGPIFYGHAVQEEEQPNHPGNVFWEQAVAANQLHAMLDGKQRKLALLSDSPAEDEIEFRGPAGRFPGISVKEFSSDQKEHLQQVLKKLVAPFRGMDQAEALACLERQGGLDACSLAFYADSDIGKDGVWDNWRLEGPSFVWYFRGDPHVHVWVNVAEPVPA